MTQLLISEEMPAPVLLSFPELSDEEFFDFCAQNSDHRIERSADGRIEITPGTGGRTGSRNSRITGRLDMWSEQDGRGAVFDSSTMFLLPNTAMRSPDAAWVDSARLLSLSHRQRDRFLPLFPDFVIELTSPSDRLPDVKGKMAEWMENGCRLGWLIHPATRTVYVYRPHGVQTLEEASEIRGEGPVDGFTLDLRSVWDPPGWSPISEG